MYVAARKVAPLLRPPRQAWKPPVQQHVNCSEHHGQKFTTPQVGEWVSVHARVGSETVFQGHLRVSQVLTNWLGCGYVERQVRILLDSNDAEYSGVSDATEKVTTHTWHEWGGQMTCTTIGPAAYDHQTRPVAVELCVLVNANTSDVDEIKLELVDAQREYFFLFWRARQGVEDAIGAVELSM